MERWRGRRGGGEPRQAEWKKRVVGRRSEFPFRVPPDLRFPRCFLFLSRSHLRNGRKEEKTRNNGDESGKGSRKKEEGGATSALVWRRKRDVRLIAASVGKKVFLFFQTWETKVRGVSYRPPVVANISRASSATFLLTLHSIQFVIVPSPFLLFFSFLESPRVPSFFCEGQ